jgi:hypothetical protein
VKIFVLYDRSGIHSGRCLGTELEKSFREKAVVHKGRLSRLQYLLKSGSSFDYIINVGWYKDFNTNGAIVINRPGAIATSSNKKRARQIFDKENIPAPQLWCNVNSIPGAEFPVVARTTSHSKGNGFWLCQNPNQAKKSTFSGTTVKKKLIKTRKGNRVWRDRKVEIEGSTHFMKFIPNTREFRVHLVANITDLEGTDKDNYFVIKLSEKKPTEKTNPNNVIKNHDNGWVFAYPEDRKDPVLNIVRETGKLAMSKFGLHWGAVDIMVSKDDNKPYVLEINSSPCLTDENSNTAEKYVGAFSSLLGLTPKMEKKPEEKLPPEVIEKNEKQKIKKLLNKIGI